MYVPGKDKRVDSILYCKETCSILGYTLTRGQSFELGNLSRQSKEWHLTQLEALNKTKRELFAAVEQQGKAFDLAIKKHRELKISATQAYEARLDDVVGKITNVLHEFKKLQKADSILGSLLFPEIHVRHSKISEAHMNTFACIFEQDVTPFKTWLQCSNEVFWINGKAGSGKSTLVKYVADHPRTETILRQWANGVKLVTVSYYFWSSGHPMQRSQEGLLQSLLFQLLCHFPDAIPVVAGSRWETDDFGVKNSVPWTRKELTAGIRFVLAQERLPARFCFFIDGLDEYSGDHTALIDDLDLLAASDTVKLCVSSRPWNAFRDAYGEAKDCQLVLEDLTKSDMSKYIKDVLEDDNRFKRLSKKESQAQIFAEEIQDKANGVFLWVILAVRSLLRGLTEHDSVEELAERLKDIPKDLETFFQRILDSVEDFYKSYMARALLLTLYAAESLPLLSFWCLQKEPPSPSGSQARVGLQCPSRSMASS